MQHAHWSIEGRNARGSGGGASIACDSAAQYRAAIQLLLAQHLEHGHVLEDEHGQIQVRERSGVRVATYWFVE